MFDLDKLKSEGYSKFTFSDVNMKRELLSGIVDLFKNISKSQEKNFDLSSTCKVYNEDKESWQRFYDICNNQQKIFKILSSDIILDILKKSGFKYPGMQRNASGLRFDFPNTPRTRFNPHQDLPYNMGGFDNLIVWLPLLKTYKEMGSLRVYPKSHLKKKIFEYSIDHYGHKVIKNIEKFNKFEEIYVEEDQGVIFSTTLIHASGENKSHIPRITILGRFFDFYDSSFADRNFNPEPMKYSKK